MPLSIRLAVIGAGKLGGALVRGWIASDLLAAENVRISNRTSSSAAALASEIGAVASPSLQDALQDADILLLGVKPYQIVSVLESIRPFLPPDCLVVSLAAGVTTKKVENALALEPSPPVVRVMTNTAALLGVGAAGFCRGKRADDAHAGIIRTLFGASGRIFEVTESQIDAVLGVSGSGIAFFYVLIEALTDGGVRAGLPVDVARALAAQTALGAASMVLETEQHPAVLKDAVTTPGGTTIAGLHAMEKAGVRAALSDAVIAARDRAIELG